MSLSCLYVPELKKVIKSLKGRGYSALRKKELISMLSDMLELNGDIDTIPIMVRDIVTARHNKRIVLKYGNNIKVITFAKNYHSNWGNTKKNYINDQPADILLKIASYIDDIQVYVKLSKLFKSVIYNYPSIVLKNKNINVNITTNTNKLLKSKQVLTNLVSHIITHGNLINGADTVVFYADYRCIMRAITPICTSITITGWKDDCFSVHYTAMGITRSFHVYADHTKAYPVLNEILKYHSILEELHVSAYLLVDNHGKVKITYTFPSNIRISTNIVTEHLHNLNIESVYGTSIYYDV